MGVHRNIGADKFPRQGTHFNRRVRIVFNYSTAQCVYGTCVRDDAEEPFETIFALDDGRFMRAVECQYQPMYDAESEDP